MALRSACDTVLTKPHDGGDVLRRGAWASYCFRRLTVPCLLRIWPPFTSLDLHIECLAGPCCLKKRLAPLSAVDVLFWC